MRSLGALFDVLALAVVQNLPGEVGFTLRYAYWRRHLKSLGKGTRIGCSVSFQNPSMISIGDHCWIDKGCILIAGRPVPGERRVIRGKHVVDEGCIDLASNIHVAPYAVLSGMGGLKIGDNCGIGSKASIYSFTHVSVNPPILYMNSIHIGNNVGVGTNATLICVPHVEDGQMIKPNSLLSGVLARAHDRNDPPADS
jgi:acetyltransferase-like isoleucine patch superfamily enzyme